MKAGILYGPRDIKLGDVPDPSIGPEEVLVECKAAGICGTDLHIFRGSLKTGFNTLLSWGMNLGDRWLRWDRMSAASSLVIGLP